jgi:hypothetical protein
MAIRAIGGRGEVDRRRGLGAQGGGGGQGTAIGFGGARD